MKTIKINNHKIIKQTNYAPLFAFKALIVFLEKYGCECYIQNKSRNTNSYYIEFESEDSKFSGEIRISDHSKKVESNNDDIEFVNINQYSDGYTFSSDIITKNGYINCKSQLSNLIINE